jgi:hypothetical protein
VKIVITGGAADQNSCVATKVVQALEKLGLNADMPDGEKWIASTTAGLRKIVGADRIWVETR